MPRRPLLARPVAVLTAALVAAAAGCAGRTGPAGGDGVDSTRAADLRLEQLGPPPVLPAPATRPAADGDEANSDPPLEAIELFARARAAGLDGRRFLAVALLEQAVALDPYSYEVNYELGRASRDGVGYDPRAAAAFERAAALDPARLDAQLDLGRQHLARGDPASALVRFRLATLTTEYADGDVRAAEADFLFAHSLAELGFDRAALDRYELLAARLGHGDIDRSAEIGDLLTARVLVRIGDLYLKRGRRADALAAYAKADAA
ncbi:MAG: hypothetical protein JWO31_1034, partial [Phycisphaerales bacterium]|nr:hypothetical protein [Phycisphaerales bacterium]